MLSCLLWADDLLLFSYSATGLQNCLNALSNYCNKWGLTLNYSKTKVMILPPDKSKVFLFHYNDVPIEQCTQYKYLGLIITENGKFECAVTNLIERARRATFKLKSLLLNSKLPQSPSLSLHLFNSLVAPILTYGAEVWGDQQNLRKQVDTFHLRMLRQILCVHKKTDANAIYGELGEYPISTKIQQSLLAYWQRISQLKYKRNTLLGASFTSQRSLLEPKTKSWLKHIHNLCNDLNIHDSDAHNTGPASFKALCRKKLQTQFEKRWKQNLNTNHKLITYNTIKSKFEYEKYLDTILDIRHRITLTKLRISAHKLEIERGRYLNVPRNNRTCIICDLNTLENEFHFLCICPRLTQLRNQLYKKLEHLNLFTILSPSIPECPFIASVLYQMYKKRQSLHPVTHAN